MNEVFIRKGAGYVKVPYADILYIENIGDYVRIRTNNGSHTIHSTLKRIGEKLANASFVKVHRSYIINLEKISNIADTSLKIDEKVIPISRANRPKLMSMINVL